jgi:hypothetical protein
MPIILSRDATEMKKYNNNNNNCMEQLNLHTGTKNRVPMFVILDNKFFKEEVQTAD